MDPATVARIFDRWLANTNQDSNHALDRFDPDSVRSRIEEAGMTPEQRTECMKVVSQCVASLQDARRRVENANMSSVEQHAPPIADMDAYGSKETVYDPHKTSTSRESMVQATASSRLKPEGHGPPSPSTRRKSQGSLSSTPLGSCVTNGDLSPIVREAMPPRKLPFEAYARETGLPMMPNAYSQMPGEVPHQNDMSNALEEVSSSARLPSSYLDPSIGYQSDGDLFGTESDSGETSASSSSNIGDSSIPDGCRTPGSHTPRAPQSSNAREDSNPVFYRKVNRRRRPHLQKAEIPPTSRLIGGRLANGKRRRVGRPSECNPSAVTLKAIPGYQPAGRSIISATGTQAQPLSDVDALGYSSQLSNDLNHALAARRQVELTRDVPQPVRLNFPQCLRPHSTIATLPPTAHPTSPPSRSLIGTPQLVFTSEIISRALGARKRSRVLEILRSQAPYLPACIMSSPTGQLLEYHVAFGAVRSLMQQADIEAHAAAPLGPNGQGWPTQGIPTEIFEQIADHLPQNDVKSMRLVNHEFERNISAKLFYSAVVSFRPDIYGMIVPDTDSPEYAATRERLMQKSKDFESAEPKGKGKAKESPFGHSTADTNIDNGLNIFESWGPRVKRFAIAFEVTEDQMAKPPLKGKYKDLRTWWGRYHWPPSQYSRFTFCHNLEQKADELPIMSAAFSHLENVRELGICMESGSGWLEGPDVSDRAQLFRTKTKVFGSRNAELEDKQKKCQDIWKGIVSSIGPENQGNPTPGHTLESRNRHGIYSYRVHTSQGTSALIQPSCIVGFRTSNQYSDRPLIFQGVNVTNRYQMREIYSDLDMQSQSRSGKTSPFATAPIVPNQLTVAQKEWLMETEWAQRAFLSSFCMALSDNSLSFKDVDSLNIAKLPSKYVAALQRSDIWQALPNLNTLTIVVAADFRIINKNASGVVEDTAVSPSQAALPFYALLSDFVASVESIKTLTIGYIGGGEHQTGIFGRNKFVLPAPVADYEDENVFREAYRGILTLPSIENLTLLNCWIAPLHLKPLVKTSSAAHLRSLTLNSVSLSAHSGSGFLLETGELEGVVAKSALSGHRRFNDPRVPDRFYRQRPYSSDPTPGRNTDLWVHKAARKGSWPDVIDSITPGPTLGFIRYAFQWCEEPPALRKGGSLQVINFKSCGYVRLVNHHASEQSALPEVNKSTPSQLCQRAIDLEPVMMHRKNDPHIGQICPNWVESDEIALSTGFPMTFGWGNNERKWDNLEDAQPLGGSGRFSGRVKKLVLDDEVTNP